MKTKDTSVNIWGLQVEMQPVLKFAEKIWNDHGHELVITSGRDGIHSAGSLHYYGYAVDIRASSGWNYDPFEIEQMVEALKGALGPDYDVIIESSHVHVEYQKILNS
jgi:hypothetical protein